MTDTAGRERLREALYPPTICKCGGAKDYHRPKDNRDHDYEPRYDPESWREGYRAAALAHDRPSDVDAELRAAFERGVEMGRLTEAKPETPEEGPHGFYPETGPKDAEFVVHRRSDGTIVPHLTKEGTADWTDAEAKPETPLERHARGLERWMRDHPTEAKPETPAPE